MSPEEDAFGPDSVGQLRKDNQGDSEPNLKSTGNRSRGRSRHPPFPLEDRKGGRIGHEHEIRKES